MKKSIVAAFQPLLAKASKYGLACLTLEADSCRIQPCSDLPEWYLVAQDDRWLLVVRGIPQIQFGPEEALKFLDRFA
ncbi:MAG: hypothetical protein ACTS2F_00480 [Thainema sp.]